MRNQKGITLIALIVTIIVLIIIAGISIATLTADNGILRQVDSAKVAQIEGTANEEVRLSLSALRIAIAEAQAKDNSYVAAKWAGKIQSELVSMLQADSQLEKAKWAANGTAATDNTAATESTFEIVYTGDDYKNACNNSAATIVYEISLTQSSIENTKITATGITSGSGASAVTSNDIGGK